MHLLECFKIYLSISDLIKTSPQCHLQNHMFKCNRQSLRFKNKIKQILYKNKNKDIKGESLKKCILIESNFYPNQTTNIILL